MKLLLVTTILLPLSALSFSLSPPLSASLLPARGTTVTTLTATVDDSSAFADYMVKSSEQKLKLEKQIADLKKQVDGVPTGAPGGAADSEMSAKIGDYETFISKYIVNAAAEKARAVKDAEEGARAKYKALLEQFAGGGGAGLELEPVGGVEVSASSERVARNGRLRARCFRATHTTTNSERHMPCTCAQR